MMNSDDELPPDHDARAFRARLGALRVQLAQPSEPVWEPIAPEHEATTMLRPTTRRVHAVSPEVEEAIIAILTRPSIGGSVHGDATRREQELRGLFLQLDVIEARELGRRLDADRDDDALASAFRRMVVDRRSRLRAILASAHRRAR